MRRPALIVALFLVLLAGPRFAVAQATDPYAAAVAAMGREDWAAAETLAAAKGPVASNLVLWSRLRAGVGSFVEYRGFAAAHAHWPGMDRLRAEAEKSIPEGADPAEVADWFGTAAPQTGEGAVRLAQAQMALGQADAAQAMLAEAWRSLGLTDEGQAAMLAAFADILAPHHTARTNALLWRWRTTEATRMLPLLDPDQRALAEARIALITDAGNAAAKVAAVPSALRGDPGLAYDRFNRLAELGDYSDAITILADRSDSAEALGQPFRWASWRATLARWAMREGRAEQAYALATSHHLTEGDSFADLEWVAGYVSLTYLDDPAQARVHFDRVEREVTGPISLSRAGYWLGRALEAGGDPDAAAAAFGRAAQNQTAFYGLLAAEKLGLPLDPALTGATPLPDWRGAPLLNLDLVQAMLLSIGAGERGTAVLFVAKLGQTLQADEIGQLGRLLTEMDEPFLTVLLGKAAVERGIVLPAIYYPLHRMATLDLPVPPELALSIARRESEFNHTVGSPVGALGLMQLMPATAQEVAGELGLPYARARLTSDWEYNAQLGARYLANLQAMFGDSPVMVAAGYNAGPSRPRTWMTQRGDPRTGGADIVDWIEHIPFSETRNYVMRVTESIPVYRARLTGETGPIRFSALLIGDKPQIRPQARPGSVPVIVAEDAPAAVAPAIAAPEAPPGPTGVPGIRPLARPGG